MTHHRLGVTVVLLGLTVVWILFLPLQASATDPEILRSEFESDEGDPGSGWPNPTSGVYQDPGWSCGHNDQGVSWTDDPPDGYGIIRNKFGGANLPDQNWCTVEYGPNSDPVVRETVEVAAQISFPNLPSNTLNDEEITQGILLRVQIPNYASNWYLFIEVVCPDGEQLPMRLQDQLLWETDLVEGQYNDGKEKMANKNVGSCSAGQVYTVRARVETLQTEPVRTTKVLGRLCVGAVTCPVSDATKTFRDVWDPTIVHFPADAMPTEGGFGYQGSSRWEDEGNYPIDHNVYRLRAYGPSEP